MPSTSEAKLLLLQQQRQQLLATMDGWSPDRLHFRPSPEEWSALQVLDHLCRIDERFPSAVRTNLPDGHDISAKDRIGSFAVIQVMRSPAKVKVPAGAKAVQPGGTVSMTDVLSRWQLADSCLAGLIEEIAPEQRKLGLFHHPVGGWMDLNRGFDFLIAHLQHHGHQLRRIEGATRHL